MHTVVRCIISYESGTCENMQSGWKPIREYRNKQTVVFFLFVLPFKNYLTKEVENFQSDIISAYNIDLVLKCIHHSTLESSVD